MKKLLFIPLLIIISFFNSCKTDFEVNADWEDISIIYCLLNPSDSVHYVKLNKCFLGNESAYVMAQISDSSNYANANVMLVPGKIKKSGEFEEEGQAITLEKTTEIIKEPGAFASDVNVLYRTPGNNNFLDISKDYKLKIGIDGKETIEAYTSLISIDNLNLPYYSFNLAEGTGVQLKWLTIENAKLYELSIFFTYVEIANNDTIEKTIKWMQKSKISQHTDGGETITLSISGDAFLQFVASKIKSASDYNPNAIRIIKQYVPSPGDINNSINKFPLELYFYTGTEDLHTYIQVSQPSNTIIQEKPSFSNITNGIGIFSCRANKTISKKIITDNAIDDLSESEITNGLNFYNSNETVTYWQIIN